MGPGIAIIGMACRYPDAVSPIELWENALAQRRAFRKIPPERLRLEDYRRTPRNPTDCTYPVEAALIKDYEFDRVRFKVAGDTFRSSDLAHWLALDVAAKALADAGLADGENLPHDSTGVVLGNTLTGEFSRANLMRLRWPYVSRVLDSLLTRQGWSSDRRQTLLEEMEDIYKKPFPPVGEETLAGGLSNTIAGRICNYFGLRGGGYTVDGACASSLLAIATACSALTAGDLDVAIAGGVDLSLDPFELIGFASVAALASEEMRVYDARSEGFWPGEGCGFVVLMRQEDAVAQGRRSYAVIRGWGVSSDGHGGITRPDVEGQLLALHRSYRRAGFGIETVPYFEGHGTGTTIGDSTELRALSRARREAAPVTSPAAVSSIKANIGHTKAAAGVAGLIKATMALHTQIIPPLTGYRELHPELAGDSSVLCALDEGKLWPRHQQLRAGVSAMGFGGINTHVALEKIADERRTSLTPRESDQIASCQDAELFLLGAPDASDLQRQIERLLAVAPRVSRAELCDLAALLEGSLGDRRVRAAVIAATASELTSRLETLRTWLMKSASTRVDARAGVFLSDRVTAPRIGFLFPGQGAPSNVTGGALQRRFRSVRELYERAELPLSGDSVMTQIAQPAIVTASLAALKVSGSFGIEADIAVGHSLGELTALHWAGALSEAALLRIARARGRAMGELRGEPGAMATIHAGHERVKELLDGEPVVIACINSPNHTVISGGAEAVAAVAARCRSRRLEVVNLPVSHAFHSPLVSAAAPTFAAHLFKEEFSPLTAAVVSTVTGGRLKADEDLKLLLYRQVTAPVLFAEAVAIAAGQHDLLIEVGPGRMLSSLTSEFLDVPSVAMEAGRPSLKGVLRAVGAAYVFGAPVNHGALFSGRFTRPFDLERTPVFLANPCELAPIPETEAERIDAQAGQQENTISSVSGSLESRAEGLGEGSEGRDYPSQQEAASSVLEMLRQLVARRAELPVSSVRGEHRLLSDLHLNSITVSQLLAEVTRNCGLRPPISPTDYADTTIAQAAQILQDQINTAGAGDLEEGQRLPSGIDSWVRTFTSEMVERPLPRRAGRVTAGASKVFADPDHPLAEPLRLALDSWDGGSAFVVCLPSQPDQHHVDLLMQGVRAVLDAPAPRKFVLVQHRGGGASLAKTLHLEAEELTTCVIDVPQKLEAVDWVLAEIKMATGFTETYYDDAGRRFEPVLRMLDMGGEETDLPLGASDVLLVTGGGKGITAECAISIARRTGARLALMGLSQPETDAELTTNLERMSAAGLKCEYIAADVTDASSVRSAVSQFEKVLGPITGILHGAALNVPQLLRSMDQSSMLQTLAIKVQGARNLLAAADPSRLRLFIAFSSIIGRTGLPGEAHYGLANEWLTRLTESLQTEQPGCRCLAIEWSVWSGVGMAQRIGGIDRLVRSGITPITPDEGIAVLHRLLTRPLPSVSVVVSGRYGELPTIQVERPELPLLRFLENPRVYYPGIELIADSELSTETDPYLDDHVFRGDRLLPAVMGLEAMAQVAMALMGRDRPPDFEQVEFTRPIVVPASGSVTIRVAALAEGPDLVALAVRSEETGFQADHINAICRFREQDARGRESAPAIPDIESKSSYLPINPERDLYGGILFHTGRFQRIQAYHRLRAKECLAEIAPGGTAAWFGRYLPGRLVLGDPGAHDAMIHAIQACIPHATILPIGADRVIAGPARASDTQFVSARERAQQGDTFIYDLELADADGRLIEEWIGLRLRRISDASYSGPWAEPLLGPYIERRLREIIPGSNLAVAVGRQVASDRRSSSDSTIKQALGKEARAVRRRDGKPEVPNNPSISVSSAHAGNVTLSVAGPGPTGCDVEPVVARPAQVWRDLLGAERFRLAEAILQQAGEGLDLAATRVWTAGECLKKAGAHVEAPLVLNSAFKDGAILLSSGAMIIVSFAMKVPDSEEKLTLAVLLCRKEEKFHDAGEFGSQGKLRVHQLRARS